MKTKLSILLFLFAFANLLGQETQKTPAFEVSVHGKGDTMFLIPGLSCSGNVWNETVKTYKDNYEIHVITLAGYGGVKPIASENILQEVKTELIGYIKKHKTKNSILIGHSIGGFTSLLIAIEDQNLVSKIIIVDSLPFLAGSYNDAVTVEVVKSSYGMMKEMYMPMDSLTLRNTLKQSINGMMRNKENLEFVVNDAAKSDRRTLGFTVFEMLSTDIRDDIQHIKTPTLVLTNWNKPIPQFPNFTRADKLKMYQKQYENCSSCTVKIIDKAEHFIMLDNPTEFYKEVSNFINE
ncbi:2-succinyl-6-hydroxy-2,4-cyclohexadiene-1-carboxylate synthase [Kordia antarctica]|uniref:2-succinyl-6-hydroxy-2, 4-cyclohexadiene-1-carboxylate synthase n=1 Tax=Kordia antarctica TaxID=1218801 RepID=A0A7L4ZMQ3_9FLAO|nr:alpha/beta hydrolase [Kordia antarctica]QHI37983.1 2-succinyl-6-hydroxy-2,4-cyclohexadiene-1-carboxylate synthase [Kordia antarctica]